MHHPLQRTIKCAVGVVRMGKPRQNCDALLLLSALASIQIAKQLTTEEVELLAAFFTVLGDNPALLALCSGPSGESS